MAHNSGLGRGPYDCRLSPDGEPSTENAAHRLENHKLASTGRVKTVAAQERFFVIACVGRWTFAAAEPDEGRERGPRSLMIYSDLSLD